MNVCREVSTLCFLVLFSISRAEWIEIRQSDEKLLRSYSSTRKGEDNSFFGVTKAPVLDEEPCYPDIHSWTAQTWSSEGNSTNESPEDTNDAPKSPEGKLVVLRALEDSILSNIEHRISRLGGREARGHKGMGSMEGALVTISLLTFAVYLIKIVMMLINAIHSKKANTMTMMPASTVRPGRRRRSLHFETEEVAEILRSSVLHYDTVFPGH